MKPFPPALLPVLAVAGLGAAAMLPPDTRCGLPVGTVVAFAGPTPPEHWMIADGRFLDRDSFRPLYEAIGTTHGAGYDGQNRVEDFNLPDYRGRFLRGADLSHAQAPSGRDRGPREAALPGGAAAGVGSVQNGATALPTTPFGTGDDSPDHAHSFSDAYMALYGGCCNLGVEHADNDNRQRHQDADVTRGANRRHRHTVVSGGDAETRPVNAAVYWIICKE